MPLELKRADLDSGRRRIESIVDALNEKTLTKAASHPRAESAANQPWLLAGVSDGMGLHTAIAAIEAGILRRGLGVYWEPPHFLEKRDDGSPVSPVHWARVQNAAALEEWAREKGADFRVLSADVIRSIARDLKGHAKGEPADFSPEVHSAFEELRQGDEDIVFINSVAFGKWICPREGEEPISVPTVDLEGRVIEMRTKSYHARGYQETLDTMGRNHGLLLESIREFGWLGPDALTAFFTWAGGSQNVDVLEGIYGRGALGDAKVIAERDVAAFRLEHGLDLGAHAIVRLPAFLSAALMGIPGGGLFGLVSRAFLEERGLFEGMPRLAERMIDRLFGPSWVRENPISQVELDTAETLYIEEISSRVSEAHDRIERFWEDHPEARDEGIELEQSKRLLEGLAPPNYDRLLRRFDPLTEPPEPETDPEPDDERTRDEDGTDGTTREFQLSLEDIGGGEFRPDLTLVRTLEALADVIGERDESSLAIHAETLRVDPAALASSGRLHCRVSWKNGGGRLFITRSFQNQAGDEVLHGETTLGERHDHPAATAAPAVLGDAVGPRMPVRVSLHETYDADDALRNVMQAPALIGFARQNLEVAGVFEEDTPQTWDVRVDGTVAIGDHLLTYARREADGWVVTVVDDQSRPLLQMTLR